VSRFVLILALAMSLLFNVFFLAGYLRATSQPTDVEQAVARELDLDPMQSEVFSQLRRTGLEDARVYQDSLSLLRQELVAEVGRDDRDLDRLRDIVDREQDLQREWKLMEASRFHEFLRSLSDEQRRKAARMCGGPHRRRAEHLRRFDLDGDGVLDDRERQAAWEHMQQRRREREQRWQQEIRERFDADGDGRLDPGERAAAESFMHQRDHERPSRDAIRERFDANGDGELDEAEREAMHQWLRDRRADPDRPAGESPRDF